MDRAYVAPETCGEIRLIYRLTRTGDAGEGAASPRLPMTLNIVLKAKGDNAIDGNGAAITCYDIARRWLAVSESPLSGIELATKLISQGWPARSDRAGKHRPHRNQSSDRARAEVGDPRFPHRLSAESVSLQCAVEEVRGSAAGEPDRSQSIFCRRRSQAHEFEAWLLDSKTSASLDRGTILNRRDFLQSPPSPRLRLVCTVKPAARIWFRAG